MNHSLRMTPLIVSVLAGGCYRAGSTATSPATESAAETTEGPERISRRTSWTIVPAADTHRYVVTRASSTQLIEDSITEPNSSKLMLEFLLTVSRQNASIRFEALVDKFSSPQVSRIGEFSPRLPVSLSGQIASAKIVLTSTPGTLSTPEVNCTNGNLALLAPVKSAFLATPFRLTSGMNWTDSVSLPGCAGSVATTTSRRSSYLVAGDTVIHGSDAILLDLTETTTAKGDGSEGQHTVRITVEGSGTGRIAIDAHNGQVLKSITVRHSEISVQTSGRTHRFRQVINEELVRQESKL